MKKIENSLYTNLDKSFPRMKYERKSCEHGRKKCYCIDCAVLMDSISENMHRIGKEQKENDKKV